MTCTCHLPACRECFPLSVPACYTNVSPERAERMQRRADQQGRSYLVFLLGCIAESETNAWHYDPLRRLTFEEREAL